MLTMTADKLAHAVGGRLVSGSSAVRVTGIAIDSRGVKPGDAYVAFAGEHHDGHEFAREALSRGASAVLITKPLAEVAGLSDDAMSVGAAVIEIGDGVEAVQDLAAWQRGRLHCSRRRRDRLDGQDHHQGPSHQRGVAAPPDRGHDRQPKQRAGHAPHHPRGGRRDRGARGGDGDARARADSSARRDRPPHHRAGDQRGGSLTSRSWGPRTPSPRRRASSWPRYPRTA